MLLSYYKGEDGNRFVGFYDEVSDRSIQVWMVEGETVEEVWDMVHSV